MMVGAVSCLRSTRQASVLGRQVLGFLAGCLLFLASFLEIFAELVRLRCARLSSDVCQTRQLVSHTHADKSLDVCWSTSKAASSSLQNSCNGINSYTRIIL